MRPFQRAAWQSRNTTVLAECAKRLDCVVFSDAFRFSHRTRPAFASQAKAVLKPPHSRRFATSFARWLANDHAVGGMNLNVAGRRSCNSHDSRFTHHASRPHVLPESSPVCCVDPADG